MQLLLAALFSLFFSVKVYALDRAELIARVTQQGVRRTGIEQILDFAELHTDSQYKIQIYHCPNVPLTDESACLKNRIYDSKIVTLRPHRFALYVDYKMPSNTKRAFLIDLETGDVEAQVASHGSGSGLGKIATKFSNRDTSHMTSLGMYMAGGTYIGGHGLTLRMYGLDGSNDKAYLRDIVFHYADYSSPAILDKINKDTGAPYDRLGHSWGCPASEQDFVLKAIPLLLNGGLILLDHEDLWRGAMGGEEVNLLPPPLRN